MSLLGEESFKDHEHVCYGNTRAKLSSSFPKSVFFFCWGIFDVILPPCRTVSPDIREQTHALLGVAVWLLGGQCLMCQLKVDMFCNVPKWWKNFFLTLDGKSTHALEHEGCHLYSRLYHCEQSNYSSDGWWTSYTTFAVSSSLREGFFSSRLPF